MDLYIIILLGRMNVFALNIKSNLSSKIKNIMKIYLSLLKYFVWKAIGSWISLFIVIPTSYFYPTASNKTNENAFAYII